MYRATRLENGLTLLTAEMPHMASVSLGIWVGVGGRYEAPALNGTSHFIEHMLFKGTAKRSARDISQAVEGIGGYLNAFTSEEHTCFYAKARHNHWPKLLEVLMDMFLHSTFDPGELEKEREVIKEELAMYLDQPQQHVQELLNETLWPGQPLGRSITGTVKTLNGLSRERLLQYQAANYVTGATVIAAAGPVAHAELMEAVQKYARHLPAGRRPPYAPATVTQQKPAICLHSKKTEQTQVALGLRGCSRHDEGRFAVRILNALLGENMSSRLFQTIREEHGLAYSIYSSTSFFDDTGDLVISAGLDTGNLHKTLSLIQGELKRFCAQLVPRAELLRASDYLCGQIDLSLENTENQMMWIGEQWLGYGKIIPPAEVQKNLSSVRASEVRNAARTLFRPDRANLALVTPLKSPRGLEPLLAF